MPIPIIVFLLLVPVLIGAFITYDSLVKLEHEQFHDDWVEDGQPYGMFWRPKGIGTSFRSGMASQKVMFVWLFKTPEWAEASDDTLKLFKRYRTLVLAWNIGMLVYFFTILRFVA